MAEKFNLLFKLTVSLYPSLSSFQLPKRMISIGPSDGVAAVQGSIKFNYTSSGEIFVPFAVSSASKINFIRFTTSNAPKIQHWQINLSSSLTKCLPYRHSRLIEFLL